ncbi:MAG: HYR domain-containing protein [Bacteroidota bacterium]
MTYFTERLSLKAIPALVCLFLLNLLVVGEISAQSCNFSSPTPDTLSVNISQQSSNGVIPFAFLNAQLGQACNMPDSKHLWIKYNVDSDQNGMTVDTTERFVYLGDGNNISGGIDLLITCGLDFQETNPNLVSGSGSGVGGATLTPGVDFDGVSVRNGDVVTFYSSREDNLSGPMTMMTIDNNIRPDVNDFNSIEVTLTVDDDEAPFIPNVSQVGFDLANDTFFTSVIPTTTTPIILNCIQDTAKLDNSGSANFVSVGTSTVRLYPEVSDCNEIDTAFSQTFDFVSGGTLTGNQVLKITRTWTFTDRSSAANSTTVHQVLLVEDTTDPLWADPTVDISNYEFAGDPDPNSTATTDSINWNGPRTLHVYLEMSDPNHQTALNYWANTFAPLAVDDCFNGVRDTLPSNFVTEVLSSKDTLIYNNCQDNLGLSNISNGKLRIRRRFFARDSVGNLAGNNGDGDNTGGQQRFQLNIFCVDNQPPAVADTPFVNTPLNAIRSRAGLTNLDTVTVFVDSASCEVMLDADDIRISAFDVISLDTVEYRWDVAFPANGGITSTSGPNFTSTDTAAVGSYAAGFHRITYQFRDQCENVGSYEFILDVQTYAPALVKEPNPNDFEEFTADATMSTGGTFTIYNEPNECFGIVPDTFFDIAAIDTFDMDEVNYSILVENVFAADPVENSDTSSVGTSGRYFTPSTGVATMKDSAFVAKLPVGSYRITYTFEDDSACPNPASVTYNLIVQDTGSTSVIYNPFPPFTTGGPAQDTIILDATSNECSELVNYAEPTGNELMSNCSGTSGVVVTRKIVSGPRANIFDQIGAVDQSGTRIVVQVPVGETVVRYYFEDRIGTMDSTDITMIITEPIDPVANCPTSPVTIMRDPNTCMVIMPDYRTLFTDNCTPTNELTINQMPAAGFQLLKDTMVTVIAEDASGNRDTCSFMVVLENTPPLPLVTALPAQMTECNTIELVAPQASICNNDGSKDTIDALPVGSVNIVAPNTYSFTKVANITVIEWRYFDSATGLSSTQLQQVNFIDDTTNPDLRVFTEYNLAIDSMGNATLVADSLNNGTTDNCTADSMIVFTVSPDTMVNCASVDSTFMVMVTATDEAGNDTTAMVEITVIDNLPPFFSDVRPNDTLACNGNAVPTVAFPTVTDNCGGVIDSTWMAGPDTTRLAGDSLFQVYNYNITRTFYARDRSKNVDSVKHVVVVRDMEAPVIGYGDSVFVDSDANITDCSATFNTDLRANIIEGCTDTAIIAFSLVSAAGPFNDTLTSLSINIPMGEDTIWIRAEDGIGNVETKMVRLIVRDRTEPVAVCKNVSASVNSLGILVVTPQIIDGGSFDNCPGNLTYSFSQDTFECADIGVQQVIMTVTDLEGNSSTCQSDLTVQDFTGTGSLDCPDPVTVGCDAELDPDLNPSLGTLSVTNLCARGITITRNDVYRAAPANNNNICQIIERTYMVNDTASGTVTTCTQIISLIDSIAPVFDTTFANTTVNCIGDAVTADSILVTDNCAPDAFAQAAETITVGTNRITLRKIWTATDSCNVVADTQMIVITDALAPEINLPVANDTFVYNTGDFVPDSCGVLVPTIDFNEYVTDCNAELGLTIEVRRTGTNMVSGPLYSEYLPVGDHSMELVATDTSGNIGRKNFVISIKDTSKPTLVCVGNRTISLGQGGTGVLQIDDIFSSATDNCTMGLDTSDARLSQTIFDCSDLGLQQVTLFVMDDAGNEGSCTVDVTVINNGTTDIIEIETSATPESIAGAADGSASVTVTGGSEDITYLWTPGNATTPTVNNLAAGLYTVVVNDLESGCRLTDTVRVPEGVSVNYDLGDIAGNVSEVIQVPVVVSNFDSVAGFSMKFRISNTNVAQFINGNEATGFAFPNLDNAFQFQNVGELDVFASNPQGVTLTDGATLFLINVRLTGTEGQVATLSAVPLNNTDIETIVILNGRTTNVKSNATPSTITIGTNVQNTFSGNISTVAGDPLADITVTLSGDESGTDVTDTLGNYSFPASSGQNLTVTPAENRQHNQGLRVTDLAIIQNHILGNVRFTSPYQFLAADVNGNERITVTDLAEIQAVILGIRTEFFTAPSWRFVPADFIISLDDPFANDIPSSISTISEDADFIAIKMGDVNSTATTVNLQTTEAKARDIFRFGVEDQSLRAGDLIEVPFKADNFQDVYAYQMTLNANPEWLTFEGIEAGVLTDLNLNNFGLQAAESGLISTLWFAAEPQSFEQNATLFTISFRVNRSGKNLSDILRTSSEQLDAAAYAEGEQAKNISLSFNQPIATEGFELFQNKPNPFSAQTTISFSVPQATAATLRFYDFSGRRVHQINGDYARGVNNVVIHKNDLGSGGVLYYEIETPNFTARKKMIVLD